MADNDMSFRQRAVIEFLVKKKSLLQKFTRDFSVLMEVCAWVRAVFEDGWNILKMGTQASKMSLRAVALEQPLHWMQQGVDEIIQDDRHVGLWTQ